METAVMFASLVFHVLPYHQNDYILILHRIEIVSYDKNHISYANAYNSKFNSTHFETTFTLHMKTDFENKLRIKVQAYKFASNEYRLFPLDFELNLCDTINKKLFGAQTIYNRGNFTRCPMKKGNYVIPAWGQNHFQFPPYVPRGGYKLDMNMTYYRATIIQFEVDREIKDIN